MTIREQWEIVPESFKHTLDAVSIMALLGNLISILPAASTVLTFIWCGLRIYESPTVQRWLERRQERRNRP